jgi:Tfp pilus assembly protein PilX
MMRALKNERGSALIMALVMVMLLALAGIWSSRTSTVETTIGANEKIHKIAFFEAEGGAETGIELLERNIDERGSGTSIGNVAVDTITPNGRFYLNEALAGSDKPACNNDRDAHIPVTNTTCTPPITNLMFGGVSSLSTGGALQMIAGYEGKGKGAAGGGAWITYDIRSGHQNVRNTESVINLRWRHVM